MTKTDYLNEEKYQKTKKVLIAIGCTSLVIAAGLLIASFFIKVPSMGEEGWFEAETLQSHLRFSAFPFGLMIPMITFFLAFGREILAFSAQQTIPVTKEAVDEMAPTAGKAAKEIAKGIKEGLKDEE